MILTNYSVRSTNAFPIVQLFFDDKIIVWPWAMVLSSINTEITFVDWQNYILTIDMSPKQICYPNLDYILQMNSEYGLFFCLPEIDNSKI